MKITKLFDALIEQTARRGGSPSMREISDASLRVQDLLAAYSEVREHAVQPGMSRALALAIESADVVVSKLAGE